MRSEDLTREQLEQLFNQLAPVVNYLRRLENQMFQRAFDQDDALYTLIRAAHQAAREARMQSHYLACDNVGRRSTRPMRGKGKTPLEFKPEPG